MKVPSVKTIILVLGDLLSLICAFLFNYFYYVYYTPTRRGFSCEDLSLRYLFHESLIGDDEMVALFFIFPLTILFIYEAAIFPWGNREVKKSDFLIVLYKTCVVFTFGMFIAQAFVTYLKFTVGRLRPFFFDVCQPDLNCSLPENRFTYITNYTCIVSKEYVGTLMRTSFPSRHAAACFQSCVVLVLYLEAKLNLSFLNLIKRFIQSILIGIAIAVTLSRFNNYKVHWSDALVGVFIGTFFGIYTALWSSDWFKKDKDTLQSKESSMS